MTEIAEIVDFVTPVGRENLAGRVYDTLREALFEGRLRPGQRLRIRDLAAAMHVSETPVREAVVQLARERALRLDAARSITVAGLTLSQYLELRTVRIELEGLAAEAGGLAHHPGDHRCDGVGACLADRRGGGRGAAGGESVQLGVPPHFVCGGGDA